MFADDYLSGMILRGLTGIGVGGTYMPGLKLVAERFSPEKRGKAVGVYIGSLLLGASLSLAVTGALTLVAGWRMAIGACSLGVLTGLLLARKVFEGYTPPVFSQKTLGFRQEVMTNRPALLMIMGYSAHMWEMYGMRGWVAPFLTASLVTHGVSTGSAAGWASTAAAVIVGVGAFSTAITGTLSDRWGRTRTITVVILASSLFSFTFGWLLHANIILIICIGIAYGYLVAAESPVFSTGLTELVAPAYLGSAMGLQTLVGYSMGMIAPTVFGWALDLFKGWEPAPGISGEWGIAFATCGAGALLGPVFMWLLRRCPESRKMAAGKR